MQHPVPNRHHHSAVEVPQMLACFRQSGLPQTRFVRNEGLSRSTLHWYLKRSHNLAADPCGDRARPSGRILGSQQGKRPLGEFTPMGWKRRRSITDGNDGAKDSREQPQGEDGSATEACCSASGLGRGGAEKTDHSVRMSDAGHPRVGLWFGHIRARDSYVHAVTIACLRSLR